MRILALGAHPDDVELLCAGTLAHYRARGAHVTIAILTNGAPAARSTQLAQSAQSAATVGIRAREAREAASVLGAEPIMLGLPDGFLYDTPETRLLIVDLLRRARPDLLFAHHPEDYHPDHRAASALASAARLLAREPGIETDHPALGAVPAMFHMDTLTGANAGTPDLWVDITDTMPTKEAMVSHHDSQNDRRRRRGGRDFVDLARRQSALRGNEVGVAYAEAFTGTRAHPPTTPADLELPWIARTAPDPNNAAEVVEASPDERRRAEA
ncbi:PIG-L family deacetylase [Embleya sp. NBC_00896]|uniref:PIG-L deacetylase family protein n=1 Tax=Embleya sp. NBC_00896 TaxID=2975961 RepID=UPI002F918161|nr:PIG-L family deacetylase [Embleya sp. NBC_00896]